MMFSLDVIDVADMQSFVQKLSEQPESRYASDILQSRANYIILKINSKYFHTFALIG